MGWQNFWSSLKIHLLIWQDSYILWSLEYHRRHFKTTQSWSEASGEALICPDTWNVSQPQIGRNTQMVSNCSHLSRRRNSYMMNSMYAFRNLQRRIKTPPSPTLVLGVHVCVCANSFQSCPTLHDCMDYHPSVHEFVQGRILEWVAISSSRGSSRPRGWTWVSYVSCVLYF